MYEDFRWSEQRKALTSMTLSMLASLNKSFLDREKSLFKNTHPVSAGGYLGNSQLNKQINEYKARFNIDLDKLEEFETLREVELARNCCVHNDLEPTDDYRNQTRGILVGKSGKIEISPEALGAVILNLAKFCRALTGQMKKSAQTLRSWAAQTSFRIVGLPQL